MHYCALLLGPRTGPAPSLTALLAATIPNSHYRTLGPGQNTGCFA